MASTAKNTLSSVDELYTEQCSLWQEVRAAIKGKYEVVKLVTCLPNPQYKDYPIYSGMPQEQINHATMCNQNNALRIKSYWARGRFFNATGRTTESLSGMIWSNEPEYELSTKLDYLDENADGAGSGLREVVQTITDEVIALGRYGVLVDMPSNEKALTQSQMEMPENAPRWIQYKPEQIIYHRLTGDSQSVEEIRLKEIRSEKKSEFQWEDKIYTRRLVMLDGVYHNQLFNDKDEMISDAIPVANGNTWDYIPFQFFGSDSNSPEYSKIPMYDLANANLGHFVLDCDNRDNLHFHGQGMTNVFTSMNPDDFLDSNPNGLDTGAKGANLFNQGDKVELLQLDATGAIPEEMLRDEQRMVMLGAQLVTNASKTQTLGAKEIEVSTSTSTLKRIAYNVSSGVEQLLVWTGMFLADTQESAYKLNTDFVTDQLTPELITKHMELVQGGVLPKVTLYETARKAGFTKKEDDELKNEAEADAAEIASMTQEQAVTQAANESNEAE